MCDRPKPKRILWGMIPAVAMLAAVFVLSGASANAGMLGPSIGVTGAGHSLKKNLGELIDHFGEMTDAAGDKSQAEKIWQDVRKTPAKIVTDAFPVLKLGTAARDGLKSAENRIKRFVGKAGETISDARVSGAESFKSAGQEVRRAVADARMALAVSDDERKLYGSGTGILGGQPLPVPSSSWIARPVSHPAASTASTPKGVKNSPWFKNWALKQQEAYPHCWGVVDADTDPEECMAEADAKRNAASKPRTDPAQPPAEGGWASGEWGAKGSGWSGWDRSDSRYDAKDREAARVSLFAARCWNHYGLSEDEPIYPLMKRRMQNNECPGGDRDQGQSDDGRSEYSAALADALGEEATASDDDYQGALRALDAKEKERKRQARLAEKRRIEREERKREVRLAEQRRRKEEAARSYSSSSSSRYSQRTYNPGPTSGEMIAKTLQQSLQIFQKSFSTGTGTVRKENSGSPRGVDCDDWEGVVCRYY